jgi:MoxR-like ATPase
MSAPDLRVTSADDAAPAAPSARASVEAFRADLERLLGEVGKRFVGHPDIVLATVAALLADGHVLLEGAPGLGKTLLVRTLADALDLSFSRIQFTPDLMPADIIGTTIIAEGSEGRRFEFRQGPVFAQVILADEINRATPKTQSALLEAMQERAVTVGRATYPIEPPFFVMATQNPIEMEGTYPLPEAELDRFVFKLLVGPPGRKELHEILERTTGLVPPRLAPVLERRRVLEMQALVRQVPIAHPVQDFAVRLVEATQPATTPVAPIKRLVRYGSSPRGAQALILGAKVRALSQGRLVPGIEDVRTIAPAALRHRLLLNFEGEAEGTSPDALIATLLASVPETT